MLENNIKEKLNDLKFKIESIIEELENFENDKTIDNYVELTRKYDDFAYEIRRNSLRENIYNLEFEIEEEGRLYEF